MPSTRRSDRSARYNRPLPARRGDVRRGASASARVVACRRPSWRVPVLAMRDRPVRAARDQPPRRHRPRPPAVDRATSTSSRCCLDRGAGLMLAASARESPPTPRPRGGTTMSRLSPAEAQQAVGGALLLKSAVARSSRMTGATTWSGTVDPAGSVRAPPPRLLFSYGMFERRHRRHARARSACKALARAEGGDLHALRVLHGHRLARSARAPGSPTRSCSALPALPATASCSTS